MWSKDIEAIEGMGCTLTAAIVAQHRAWYCHVGDSRLYQIGSTTCVQTTDDQIVTGDDSRDGKPIFSKEERRGGDLLAHALGIEDRNPRLTILQGAIALSGGDALLLCSDGLYATLSERCVAHIVRSEGATATRVHNLINSSLEAGSSDDITAVLVALAADSHVG